MAVRLDKTLYHKGPNGILHVAPGRQLYVLQPNGSLDRTVNLATETLVEGFTDEALTVSAGTGPFSANGDGQFDVWFPAGSYDLYAPADVTNPLTRWQPIAEGVAIHDADALAHPALRTRLGAVEASVPVDVRDYAGIDLTGASDSSTGLALAVAEAAVAGRRLYIPKGVVVCAAVLLKSGSHIVGDGMNATTLRLLPSSANPILHTHDASGNSIDDVTIEGLTLDGDRVNSTVTGTAAAALLHSYEAARWHLSRVRIKNGRGYGFAWQGFPTATDATKQGPQTDLYMEFCELLDNGWLPDGTSNSMDNIDIKSSERVAMHAVYAKGASDKGFNIRGRYTNLVACRAHQNGTGFDMNSNNDPADSDNLDSYHHLLGCAAEANSTAGFAAAATEDSVCHVDLVGCAARKNSGSGFAAIAPPGTGKVRAVITGGHYISNTLDGIQFNNAQVAIVKGAVTRGNGRDGCRVNNQLGARVDIDSQSNTGYGLRLTGTCANIEFDGVYEDNTAGQITGVYGQLRPKYNVRGAPSVVTAAATTTLPPQRPVVTVNGATGITSIVATFDGDMVVLRFSSTPTVTDGGNLLLAGNFVAAINSTLTLTCDGTNWRELSRSVN